MIASRYTYGEAHHVAPVAARQVGSLSAANVVTVCANHHRQLHYGGVPIEVAGDRFRFALPEREVTVPRFKPDSSRG